jgi:hypothetical protein
MVQTKTIPSGQGASNFRQSNNARKKKEMQIGKEKNHITPVCRLYDHIYIYIHIYI